MAIIEASKKNFLKGEISTLSYKHSLFWKHTVIVNLKKFSSNNIFRWSAFGGFCMLKCIFLAEELMK